MYKKHLRDIYFIISTAINQINTNLTANNNKYQATYSNGKYGFTIDNIFYALGGSKMKCAKYGIYEGGGGGTTVDISDLNLSSAEDYFVILNGGNSSSSINAYLNSKTATSFTITVGSGSATVWCSYQVITFE